MINLYTTETCPRCQVVEYKLDQKNIQYNVVHDIDLMTEKGISTVPQMEIDNGPLMQFSDIIKWINEQ